MSTALDVGRWALVLPEVEHHDEARSNAFVRALIEAHENTNLIMEDVMRLKLVVAVLEWIHTNAENSVDDLIGLLGVDDRYAELLADNLIGLDPEE